MPTDNRFKPGAIQKERIKQFNTKSLRKGEYVLYWMQASPRTEYNHALEYAIEKANERSYWFMIENGLKRKFDVYKYIQREAGVKS